ncbi:unnamed protein product [Strongylus vulgaris]|uniref:Uncharacterized protein n=1 Tax=Strongylus vulgaris TaxID=40348 RepID=A0A3P7J8G3_STRVU|nr:unnamed protein product [Strongylus vulgaris]
MTECCISVLTSIALDNVPEVAHRSHSLKEKEVVMISRNSEVNGETQGSIVGKTPVKMVRGPTPKPRTLSMTSQESNVKPRMLPRPTFIRDNFAGLPPYSESSDSHILKERREAIAKKSSRNTKKSAKKSEIPTKSILSNPQNDRPKIPPKPCLDPTLLGQKSPGSFSKVQTEVEAVSLPSKTAHQRAPQLLSETPSEPSDLLTFMELRKPLIPRVKTTPSPPEPKVKAPTPAEAHKMAYANSRHSSEDSVLSDFSEEEPELVILGNTEPLSEEKPLGDLFPARSTQTKHLSTSFKSEMTTSPTPPEPSLPVILTEEPPIEALPLKASYQGSKQLAKGKKNGKRSIASTNASTILLFTPPEPPFQAPTKKCEQPSISRKQIGHSAKCIYNKKAGKNYWAARLRKNAKSAPLIVVHVCYCAPGKAIKCCACDCTIK